MAESNTSVVKCWELRGCHGIQGLTAPMSEECPHARIDCYSPCPAECKYSAACSRPWHKTTSDFNLILNPDVDRMAAIKKQCYVCEHFLTHGPSVSERVSDAAHSIPDTATRDSSNSVTLHVF